MKAPESWFLFLHQIPPKPSYFRAKVLRRLTQLGALAVKNSAYLLPANDETHEDLQWLLREIRTEGGEAWMFRSQVAGGETDDGLRAKFRSLHAADWLELSTSARSLLDGLRAGRSEAGAGLDDRTKIENLQRMRADLRRTDFFGASERDETECLMIELEKEAAPPKATATQDNGIHTSSLQGRTWITRAGVRVDRIGSVWLIRRFIDPEARFEFVNEAKFEIRPGDLRFDMFEGEFTHQGDSCTFEVLLERCELTEPALRELAEIVHDIDCKDGKFGRPEVAGVQALIDGIVLGSVDDLKRIDEGARLFDALYASKRSLPRPG